MAISTIFSSVPGALSLLRHYLKSEGITCFDVFSNIFYFSLGLYLDKESNPCHAVSNILICCQTVRDWGRDT